MVTPINTIQNIDGVSCATSTYFGLSTDSDSKPTEGVGNGSAYIEMDTSTIYFFDAENSTWLEWGASDEA